MSLLDWALGCALAGLALGCALAGLALAIAATSLLIAEKNAEEASVLEAEVKGDE